MADAVSGASAGYAYDRLGNVQSMVYGNGVTNAYQYDALNRLTNLVWQAGSAARAKFAYQLDLTGNRTNSTETVNGTSQVNAWSFDSIYRLTNEVAGSLASLAYQYDVVGNRLSRNSTFSGLTNQTFTFNTNDWLSSDKYDGDGNTTNSWNNAYQYDPANEVTNVNNAISLVYDGDGSRVMKQVGTITTYYVVDDQNPSGYPQVLEELVDSGNGYGPQPAKTYTYGLALVSQQPFSAGTLGTLSYYGYDGHGSVRFLMNSSGGITDTYAYDAFGNIISHSGSTSNNYLYCAQQWDPDLGLYYNRARYLNPNACRFWTSDQTDGDNEDPLSLHKYLYAECDPVDNNDPLGLYTPAEGYAVEKQIRDQYAIDHGDDDVNRTGGPIGVGKNPDLKPDIWNKSSDPKTFAEIKPLSLSGIAHGITQLNKYENSLKGLLYVRDNWPTDPSVRTFYENDQPYFYFNIHGLILYTVIEPPPILPIVLKDAKTLAKQQAEQLLKQGATTLTKVVGERAILVGEAESAEFEEDAIEAF